MGATLLFWGWQTGLLPFAVVIAVLLEGARLTQARRAFSQAELDRLWNLCTLVFLGTAAYVFTAGEGGKTRTEILTRSARSVFLFFQWMPLYFIPIMAAQAWSQREWMARSTFSWWLRKQRTGRGARPREEGLNVSYPYFGICLLGASAARGRSPWFLAGLLLLLGWAFWARRSRSRSPVAWAGSLLTAVAIGLAAQRGLFYVQAALQRLDTALVTRFSRGQIFDVSESRTMLGAIGDLKLSGRIVMRVNSPNQTPPALLREASYNLFKSTVWGSSKREFRILVPEKDESTWLLLTNRSAKNSVSIAALLPGGEGVLALPQGVARLERLPVLLLEANRLGAVRSTGPGFVEFTARYQEGASIDDPPDERSDFEVPVAERAALDQILAELKVGDKAPEEVVQTVAAFFNRQFEYSAWLGDNPARLASRTAISHFLLHRRKGHCEYFATATTLLLRQAGIPARYAVGYAVQERKGREYLVRARHAHAWCLAWLNGAWREIDTTPGSWVKVEAGRASFWEPISDAWARLRFAFSKWRWGQSAWRKYLVWMIVLPVFGALAGLLSAKGWRRARMRPTTGSTPDLRPGFDSEFYLIERRLAELGLGRHGSETPLAWLRRITGIGSVSTTGIEELIALHYRLRFDPDGIGSPDRAALSHRVREWLNAFERQALPRR